MLHIPDSQPIGSGKDSLSKLSIESILFSTRAPVPAVEASMEAPHSSSSNVNRNVV
jgi:hypothetical protein